jgi:hypothetical protein
MAQTNDYVLGFEEGMKHQAKNYVTISKPPVLTTKMLLDGVRRLKYAAQYELLSNLIGSWEVDIHNNRVLGGDSEKNKLLVELCRQLRQMRDAVSKELRFE